MLNKILSTNAIEPELCCGLIIYLVRVWNYSRLQFVCESVLISGRRMFLTYLRMT